MYKKQNNKYINLNSLLKKLNNDLESIESELNIKNDKDFKNFVNVYYDITEVLNNNYKSKN